MRLRRTICQDCRQRVTTALQLPADDLAPLIAEWFAGLAQKEQALVLADLSKVTKVQP